jgi:hypothetical protein
MIKAQRLFIAGLVACLAAAPVASGQSPMANPGFPITDNSVSTNSSGEVLPSDSALGAVLGSEIGQVGSRPGGHKTSQSISTATRDIRNSLETGGIPGLVSRLCFQPGVGWQPVPSVPFKPVHAAGSVTAGGSEGIYQQLSETKPRTPSQCPGMLGNASASGGGIEGLIVAKMAQSRNSVRVASTNAGTQDWLHANSVINPASSVSAQKLIMGLTSGSSASKQYSQGTDSNVSEDQVRDLARHAYISPIKLRRMMRNVPDLETRIAMRESSDELANTKKRTSKDGRTARNANGQAAERSVRKQGPTQTDVNAQGKLYRTNNAGTPHHHTYP